jgi:small subunit ribosomal protein S4
MARDRSPITKQSRQEGVPLHPKAFRIMIKRTSPPGRSAQTYKRGKPSQYAIQLREKQKAKRTYGLLEKQFSKLIGEASTMRGQTGEILLSLLERRLDNLVYRAGFAPSRRASRQLVSHGHFMLNDRRVNIPSIRVKPGDVVKLRQVAKKNNYFKQLEDIMANIEVIQPSWLSVNKTSKSVSVTSLPRREDSEQDINEQLIVEYYSR